MKTRNKDISHQYLDRRSLALHREIAKMLEKDPSLIKAALNNIRRWVESYKKSGSPLPESLKEWSYILAKESRNEIIRLLRARSEKAKRLRQSSPFAGIIPNKVRNQIIESFSD